MSIRTKIIQKLVHINEGVFFYPKLKKFYKENLINQHINILDVGANKGQSIDFFKRINQNINVHAFEPNKKLFSFLLNKYKTTTNVKLYNFGVSNIKGDLVFHENILDETSTFEELNLESKYLEKKAKILGVSKENLIVDNYKVEVIRLSDFINENPHISFDVLKIDVEGHELKCLQGLFSDENKVMPIRFIQLESHKDDMYLSNSQHQDIEKILVKHGFEIAAEFKHGFGDFAELIYVNKRK
ncbi:FkbM family methyltransferase [Gaetbulibacter aquiaggeris]|uniref:FkbM family methyltransferase n=1 Tax=Gaetbulibacter aquiaggeris TaxID=1735373 RepID=A0ABW7MNP8_9FLAO